jgi:hypothetical protein
LATYICRDFASTIGNDVTLAKAASFLVVPAARSMRPREATGADGGVVELVERRLHRRGASTGQDQGNLAAARPSTVNPAAAHSMRSIRQNIGVGIGQKPGVLKRIGTDARMA